MEVADGPGGFLGSYRDAILRFRQQDGVEALVTGDILDVCDRFMERACEGTGVELVRPLWGVPRGALLSQLREARAESIVTCASIAALGKEVRAGSGIQRSERRVLLGYGVVSSVTMPCALLLCRRARRWWVARSTTPRWESWHLCPALTCAGSVGRCTRWSCTGRVYTRVEWICRGSRHARTSRGSTCTTRQQR